jgi:hypothetical protein
MSQQQATLNVVVIPKRMLTKTEAACHCGRPVKRFILECRVKPIRFPNGDERYDLHDIDAWLDNLKDDGHNSDDVETIIDKLR